MNDDEMNDSQHHTVESEEQSPFQALALKEPIADSIQRNVVPKLQDQFFVSGGESLLSKIGGMLLAKAYLPSGSHIKEALIYFDLGIKFQLVLHELQSTLFWLSSLECGLFIVSIFLFFTDPVEMVYVWYHTVHIVRCVIGFRLYHLLPRSHQMAANMSIPLKEKMPFDRVIHYVLLAAKDALSSFTSLTRRRLFFYFISTLIALALDLTTFFIQVKYFARAQSAFADISLLIIASLFLFIDWYYFLWLTTLMFKFPEFVATAVIKSFFGIIEDLHQKLGVMLSKQKMSFQERQEMEREIYTYVQKPKNEEPQNTPYPNPLSARSSASSN